MLSLFTKKYSTTIRMNTSREKAWDVLDDFDNYHAWNSFTIAIDTNRTTGSKVRLTVQMKLHKKPIVQTEYLRNYKAQEAMDWGMDWGPFLRARRIQRLRTISPTITEYFTEDTIWGLLCPVVHWLYGKHIQAGFERMATELKQHVEKS
ncbi:MAG: SRPBCC domain-containing protein [Cyclobacteriaceae bacterium]|nr:SRPBCC domain-containing protein [Cyclobacteriaceae bacterium]